MDFSSKWVFTGQSNIPIQEDILLSVKSGKIFIDKCRNLTSAAKRRFIMPFFSNAHTHLELSFLKDKMVSGSTFVSWLKALLDKKQSTDRKSILEGMQIELNRSWINGTGIIFDICNDLSFWNEISPLDKRQTICVYYELLGFDPQNATEIFTRGIDVLSDFARKSDYKTRLTPHSLYACSESLIKKIKSADKMPMTIHLAEHQSEVDLFEKQNGEMVEYLKSLNRWNKNWVSSDNNLIFSALAPNMLGKNDLAVHLVKAKNDELKMLAERAVIPCLCPRSNDFFSNGQPDVAAMLDLKMRPLLGTDSIASNKTLNMLDEMIYALKKWDKIDPLEILKMATTNIGQIVSDNTYNRFYPLENGKSKPFLEIIFKHEIKDLFESLRSDVVVEQNIHV